MGDSNNNNEYEEVCCLCRRSENKAGKMTKLPGNMCVCKDCLDRTYSMIKNLGFEKILGEMPSMDDISFNGAFTNNQTKDETDAKSKAEADEEVPEKENKANEADDSTCESENGKDENESGNESKDSSTYHREKRVDGRTTLDNYLKGFPGISFLNISDIMNGADPNRTRVKKKSPGEHKPLIDIKDIPAPHKIKASLDEYIIGQEYAKKVISVAVYNHYKRVATNTMDSIEVEKSNMLMIGPTGCGKTYLVKTLAKLLDVPLAIADATSLTEAGYIGDDIESVISKLLAAADNDVEKAEMGIVFIDEIDKIAKKTETKSRDVSGESVQQGLLRLLEGAEVEVPVGAMSKNAMVPLTTINTRNILFICGGAFPDLAEIIKHRLHKTTSIGFGAELKDQFDNDKDILSKVTIEDLKQFGMIPEFIGRLPIIYTLHALTEEMLIKILKEPKNAILKQYAKLLELDEVKLEFDDGAIEAIAQKALERDTGARALRSIIEEFMLDIMYEIPKDDNIGRVVITREYIEGIGGPIIDIRNEVGIGLAQMGALQAIEG